MSTEEIRVKVTRYSDRKYYVMYYDCPDKPERETRSSRKTTRREAEREAAKWEAELREGRYCRQSKITWEAFRERYEDEHLASLAEKTDRQSGTAFNALERTTNPKRLTDVTEQRLSQFQKTLRDGGSSEATIRSYLKHICAALSWAAKQKIIREAPNVTMPKRAKGYRFMKGRPIVTEEFERMLAKTESVLGSNAAATWRRFQTGLWLSGLRLGEALNLWWDSYDKLTVDLTGRRPMFVIRADLEKGNQDRLLPMTPDFAEFLLATPEEDRTGPVFRLIGMRGGEVRSLEYVSDVLCQIGEAAGVKVNESTKTNRKTGKPELKVKFASAHDLRRSFGARWAVRVMPAVLQQLMRHEDIQTTMKFYVGQNAEATADAVWAASEKVNTFVNSGPNQPPTPKTAAP